MGQSDVHVSEVENLREEIGRLTEEARQSTAALEAAHQEMDRQVDANSIVSGQRDRLWQSITAWMDTHKRTCYAALSGGFCAECKWVLELIKNEEGMPANPVVASESPPTLERRRVIDQGRAPQEETDNADGSDRPVQD